MNDRRRLAQSINIVEENCTVQDEAESSLLNETHTSGYYNDYEKVLEFIGFGLFHIILFLSVVLAVSADTIEIMSISYVLPYLRLPNEFHMTDWQSGFMSSILPLGMLIGGYTLGALADIVGRRKVLVVSLLVNSFFAIASAFSPNFYVLLLLRFLSGMG